jgi:hypothetical protein
MIEKNNKAVVVADSKPQNNIILRGLAFLYTWFIVKVSSFDTFAGSAPPFNFGDKGSKASTFIGGTMGLILKVISIAFFAMKLNEMIFFASGSISVMTI